MRQLIDDDLDAFDARLARELESDVQLLGDIGLDLIRAGGKRIRPRLALLTARLLGTSADHGLTVALSVEMLHTASLLHDDLIDDADTRRGSEAAFRRYGNSVSVMAGDFLLARTLRVLARNGNMEFVEMMAETAAVICEAEVRQFQAAETQEYSFDTYLQVIDGKTASLMAAATAGVAVLSGAPADALAALREFGLRYGRAFQLRDDFLDLMSDARSLGKPVGNDLGEGKATWPTLLLLDAGVDEARLILERRAREPGDVERMVALVREHGADIRTERYIAEQLELATRALDVFPASPERHALLELAAPTLAAVT